MAEAKPKTQPENLQPLDLNATIAVANAEVQGVSRVVNDYLQVCKFANSLIDGLTAARERIAELEQQVKELSNPKQGKK